MFQSKKKGPTRYECFVLGLKHFNLAQLGLISSKKSIKINDQKVIYGSPWNYEGQFKKPDFFQKLGF